MVHHVREGQDEYGISRSQQIVGAILHRATTPCDVDTWRLCYDLKEMLSRDSRDVIYGGTEPEIESEIWKRHPIEGSGVTLITPKGTGWEIERTPRLMHADLETLQEACVLHKRVLAGNDLIEQLGGRERLLGLGFLPADRNSRNAQLLRYNPRQVVVNRWKGQVEQLGRYLEPEFAPGLMERLFDAVKPDRWPQGHPFKGCLKAEADIAVTHDTHPGGWGRRRQRGASTRANLTDAPGTILSLVQIARRLGRGEHGKPWRRTAGWRQLLEELVRYVHGVEHNGGQDWKRLARWIRAQARAARVKVPRGKKLPPRPTFGKRAGRNRRQPYAP
jgi:hypothetical protein